MLNLSTPQMRRRKVVHVWVAGFLSEDMDKQDHWKQLTEFMP
jgi:hypothetical protein